MKRALTDATAGADSWVRVERAILGRRTLGLFFALHSGRCGGVVRRFAIECGGVIEHHIGALDGGGLRFYQSFHPAARQYHDAKGRLALRAVVDANAIVGALAVAHSDAVDDWISLDRYLGEARPLSDRLASGRSVAINGPLFLLRAYHQALRRVGVESALVQTRSASSRRKPRVLHFSGSFVVAESFQTEASS